MRLASIQGPQGTTAALVTQRGPIAVDALARLAGRDWPTTVEGLVQGERLDELRRWCAENEGAVAIADPVARARPARLLARPPKILGVGLNYADHAGDLGEKRPDEPATFMKPATTLIGPGDEIPIPRQSERTTGEAELGLVIGRHCKDVREADAPDVIAGFTTLIDMTAEDILQRNPRFLTRAKSFDGFLVAGPDLVAVDEVDDVAALEVTTWLDGEPVRRNTVSNMMFSPWYLVAFFSAVMPLEPGDVICTGTPGAVVLRDGATVGCKIPGVGEVTNPVVDLEVRS